MKETIRSVEKCVRPLPFNELPLEIDMLLRYVLCLCLRAREPNQNNIIILFAIFRSVAHSLCNNKIIIIAVLNWIRIAVSSVCCVRKRIYKVFVFELIIIDFLQLLGIVSSCDDDQNYEFFYFSLVFVGC